MIQLREEVGAKAAKTPDEVYDVSVSFRPGMRHLAANSTTDGQALAWSLQVQNRESARRAHKDLWA